MPSPSGSLFGSIGNVLVLVDPQLSVLFLLTSMLSVVGANENCTPLIAAPHVVLVI